MMHRVDPLSDKTFAVVVGKDLHNIVEFIGCFLTEAEAVAEAERRADKWPKIPVTVFEAKTAFILDRVRSERLWQWYPDPVPVEPVPVNPEPAVDEL